MVDARDLPNPIQWHEGMLLAPQHFQQSSRRFEEILHYNLMMISPFHWGVRRLKIDQILILEGTLRVLELEAIMPDGLVVCDQPEYSKNLEIDLTPYTEEMKQAPVTVHLAVPEKKIGLAAIKGALARYDSVEGKPVADENTGESDLSIPSIIPRVSLLVTETPPQKYTAFPLLQVIYQNEAFVMKDYIAPALTVPVKSAIGEMCTSISRRLREKAVFLSERLRSPSLAMKGPLLITTKSMIQSLVSALSHFEAVLYTGVSHPYTLYLSLCNLVGQVATLGQGLIPPVLAPYNHNDLRATFNQAIEFITRMIDEGILESHTAIAFDLQNGIFSLFLEEPWMTQEIVIGIRAQYGLSEKDVLSWMEDCLIGSETVIESMKNRRILGASRQRIEGDEELIPVRGVILFAVTVDPEFIRPGKVLKIFNTAATKAGLEPAEIVLYVKNEFV